MTRTIPMMEARKQFTILPELLSVDGQVDVAEITRRGKPVLAVMPWTLYETLSETLEIMGDPELMSLLRQSIHEMEANKLIPWQDAKRELGL